MADSSYVGFGSNPQETQRHKVKKRPAWELSNMENTFITLDKSLEYVGDNSVFQKRVIYLLSVQWGLFTFLTMGMPFLYQNPVFLCQTSPGANYTVCDEKVYCATPNTSRSIDENASSWTLAYEFELYCEKSYLSGLGGSVFFFGSSIGGFIFPPLSDRSGRKKAILFTIGLAGLTTVICGVMNNYNLFLVFLGISGVGFNGFETLSMVYVAEISAVRFRNYSTVTLLAVSGFAQILFSGVLLISKNWRIITAILIGAPSLISLLFSWKLLCETPRYLVTRARYNDARTVLNLIAVTNKRPQFKFRLVGEMDAESKKALRVFNTNQPERYTEPPQAVGYNYFDLFRFGSLRSLTFFSLYIWFFRYLAYYGLNFSLESFGAELYTNFTISAFAETIACILSAPIKLRMGRIESMIWSTGLVTVSCLLIWFFPIPNGCYGSSNSCYQKTMSVTCAVVVKFGITIFANILITYTSEVYPTVVRTLGFGLCMTFGRLGNVAMPIFVSAMQKQNINPIFSFGFLGIIAMVLLKFMPENKEGIDDYIREKRNLEMPLLGGGNNIDNETQQLARNEPQQL